MTFLAGAILLALSGFCIAHFIKITRGHFICDMALGWFVGAAYYCVITGLIIFGAGLPMKAAYSVIIVILPVLVMAVRIKSYLPSIAASMEKVKSMEYLPGNRLISFHTILLGYSFFVFVLVFLHGASTPIIHDDALHLRSYTPLLAYGNFTKGGGKTLIFFNGLLPSFIPLFFWHIKGEAVRFYINYTVLVSFLCFLIIVYLAPALRGNSRQGIYSLFFIMSLPLFLIHGTITYVDAGMAIPYALGFLFFTFYVRDFDAKDLKTLVLFFIITCMIKEKGVIAGITGIAVTLMAYIVISVRNKRINVSAAVITALVLIAIPAFFLYRSSAGLGTWGLLKTTPVLFNESIVQGLLKPMIDVLFYGETLNFSQHPYYIRLFGFSRSLFSSGNFGIIFYVLFATMLINLRSVFKGDLLWNFLFWGVVFSETFIYMVILYTNLNNFEDIVHRTVMVLAIISSIYLSSLLARLSPGIAIKS